MKTLVSYSSLAFLATLGFLPSSSLGFFPVKTLFFAGFIGLFFLFLLYSRNSFKINGFDFLNISAICFLSASCIISLLNGFDYHDVFAQGIPLFTTIITLSILYVLLNNNVLEENKVLNVAVYSYFVFGFFKTALFSLFLLRVIDWHFVKLIFDFTNYSPVELMISGGYPRLSYVALDFSFLLAYFYWLFFLDSKSLALKVIVNIISFVVIFTAYSRFLFAIYALMTLAYLMTRSFSVKFIFFAFIALVVVYNHEIILDMFNQRFVNQGHSDNERVKMIHMLFREAGDYFPFGAGAGSHIYEFVRSEKIRYSYEVQPLAFLFQFGIWWLIYLSVFILFTFFSFLNNLKGCWSFFETNVLSGTENYQSLKVSFLECIYAFVGMFFLILGAFTNQYIGSTSIIGVFTIWILSFRRLGRNCSLMLNKEL